MVASTCGVECPCDPGEIQSAGGTRCYYVDTTSKDWQTARADCIVRGSGWDLAAVGTATEQTLLQSVIGADAWIGFSDSATEGSFAWTNGEALNYSNWDSGQPDNAGEEDCGRVKLGGKWDDTSCTASHRSICEGPTNYDGKWSQSCVDKVESICDVTCGAKSPSTCSHDPCATGAALASACHPCVEQICAQDPACCSNDWDSACVGKIWSICQLECPIALTFPPSESGECEAWAPGKSDPNCTAIDLAGGVPCDGTIPVCNHGSTTAPAGVRIIHYPANSNQYPKCNPDQTHPQMYECFTDQPIPPGQCLNVTNCPQLIGNREVMVNPPGSAQVEECSCKDNWTLYSGQESIACETPDCPDCPKALESTTYTEVYQAVCPDGKGPLWGYLAFETTTPGDSNVSFKIRTAGTESALASASYVDLREAHATPDDTQLCAISGPAPCPIALYPALGGAPAARYSYLELALVLNPSSDGISGPTVKSWQITYSCVDNQ
jgi:hypothetical protein